MSKIANALMLLNILSDGKRHKAKEIAQKMELKESTINYYIDGFIQAGYYIESVTGSYGGYRLVLDKNKQILYAEAKSNILQ